MVRFLKKSISKEYYQNYKDPSGGDYLMGINLIWGKWLVDRGGMVFSVDLMLALIIITVVLGVSADAMDMIGSKMDDSSHEASLERIARLVPIC